jgi:hypothetical protein
MMPRVGFNTSKHELASAFTGFFDQIKAVESAVRPLAIVLHSILMSMRASLMPMLVLGVSACLTFLCRAFEMWPVCPIAGDARSRLY